LRKRRGAKNRKRNSLEGREGWTKIVPSQRKILQYVWRKLLLKLDDKLADRLDILMAVGCSGVRRKYRD
jgi:hypothetical protein